MNFCQCVFLFFFSNLCQYSLLKTADAKDFHLLTIYSNHHRLPVKANCRSMLKIRGAENNIELTKSYSKKYSL